MSMATRTGSATTWGGSRTTWCGSPANCRASAATWREAAATCPGSPLIRSVRLQSRCASEVDPRVRLSTTRVSVACSGPRLHAASLRLYVARSLVAHSASAVARSGARLYVPMWPMHDPGWPVARSEGVGNQSGCVGTQSEVPVASYEGGGRTLRGSGCVVPPSRFRRRHAGSADVLVGRPIRVAPIRAPYWSRALT